MEPLTFFAIAFSFSIRKEKVASYRLTGCKFKYSLFLNNLQPANLQHITGKVFPGGINTIHIYAFSSFSSRALKYNFVTIEIYGE